MSFEYRLTTEDEFPSWRKMVRRGFNAHVHPDDIPRMKSDRVEMDRLFAAVDGDEIVGTGGADSQRLSVPGGRDMRAAGIAFITTAATHRRRGVLTGMMKTLFNQARERKEPLAVLWASESAIYSRFGFGQSTAVEDWKVETSRSEFTHMPKSAGRVRYVEHNEALRIMPKVWAQASRLRSGFLDRAEGTWRYYFFDEERVRAGWSGLFFVVFEHDGQPEGYAAFRTQYSDPPDDGDLSLRVIDSVDFTDRAHAAIWRLLFDVDLVDTVHATIRPPDDPVLWMLADPRALERTAVDGLWTRVIDPVTALSGRGYSADDRLVIEVRDEFWPDAGGTFELEASGDEAECRRATARADISMSATELGATYLGGTKLSGLARAGKVAENTRGAVNRFDRMFLADPAPWCPHEF